MKLLWGTIKVKCGYYEFTIRAQRGYYEGTMKNSCAVRLRVYNLQCCSSFIVPIFRH